uniref:Uncharacterized protein n=1 Tax=Caenorhabditis tropicalis TaxID=1561998 RepID=A0A1I7U851_9PELO
MEKPLLMKKAGRELEMSEKMLKEWSSESVDVVLNGCLQMFSQNQNPCLFVKLFYSQMKFIRDRIRKSIEDDEQNIKTSTCALESSTGNN